MAAYTTIDDPSAFFQTKLYTGNGTAIGSGGNAQTFDSDTDMQPDLVWIIQRNSADNHIWTDSVRGATKYVNSDRTNAEATNTESLTAFNSDGFTLGNHAAVNASSDTFVAWCWKESAVAGMDIVLYTGNGTDDTDISHSLSAVPHVMIMKKRSTTGNWEVYHHRNTSAPETDYLNLDLDGATGDSAGYWSDEAPTSSVFTLGNGATNTNAVTYVSYLFSEKQGYSKFGSYSGNADADGTFVYLGFKPGFLMIKKTNGSEEWYVWDTKREGFNGRNDRMQASAEVAEYAEDNIDLLSNGFKCKANSSRFNGSGGTYIYMAFAEAPLVNSKGVPCNGR
jgi:hypothetical protein